MSRCKVCHLKSGIHGYSSETMCKKYIFQIMYRIFFLNLVHSMFLEFILSQVMRNTIYIFFHENKDIFKRQTKINRSLISRLVRQFFELFYRLIFEFK